MPSNPADGEERAGESLTERDELNPIARHIHAVAAKKLESHVRNACMR
jgi:hypothetical protein